VSGRFIAATRVTDESGEFDDGKIRDVRILIQDPNDATLSECATGGTTGEDFGGRMDSFGTDRTEAVATEESHRRPPIDSMRATMAITSAKARMARGPWYLLGIFMFFDAHIQRAHAKETTLSHKRQHRR
jgi:hypothetical protein